MPSEVSFSSGTVVGSRFLNDRQEIESPTAWGVRLEAASVTAVRCPIAVDGSSSGQTTIIINGSPRLITVAPVLGFSGQATGTYDVYATLAGVLIGDGFSLQGVTHGAGIPASSRKIGEVDWSGVAILQIRNMIDVAGHGWLHRGGGPDPVEGLTEVSMDLTRVDGTAATPSMRTLGGGAQQAAAGNDSRFPPVGAVMALAGSGDPLGGTWVIADGRLIDSTLYPAFDAKVGVAAPGLMQHAYNLGVNPGNNGLGHQQVKIPDKRGKSSRGAANMGTGAVSSDASHAVTDPVSGAAITVGYKGGETTHTETNAEMNRHGHGNATGGGTAGGMDRANPHGHGIGDPGHAHNFYTLLAAINNATSDSGPANLSTGGSFGRWQSSDGAAGTGVYAGSSDINHLHSVPALAISLDGSGAAHNNLDGYEADSYIVRIA